MNPVRGYTMMNFLQWLTMKHPEVKQLRSLDENELITLVNEFEKGKLTGNDTLQGKWIVGFHELLNGRSDWQGYDMARRELRRQEQTNQ